ncbi:glycoprotein-N-acetylgalactosamine 3-beta-galactosyltransferase 1 isoform X2 [Procambarus clarkii]|uniref:glycoprotein-N-acetylgalactosamine 3-beta-galactosyltransferase 1 isoform X2 n=1 Tax=Procambarus clarkii TaxID=6728 RepID=UPI001E6735DF|nr:glycoprotein-N-acetylgalactosamine 3-beta-galactosyltransferase 1-like isoform X2 [Procambarus clarkii]
MEGDNITTMARRLVAGTCVRTLATFLLGFGLGVAIHLFVGLSLTDSEASEEALQEAGWSAEEGDPDQLTRWIPPLNPHHSGGPAESALVLCYILTGPTTHHRALHVRNTWGQRCDRIVFYSTQEDPDLQTEVLDVPEGYGFLWAKTKGALAHLHRHHPEYDWYLKADDDTFVIVENLRYFLRGLDSGQPVYYGVKFRQHVKQGYMSGGGGYVLSREAVKRFVTKALPLKDQSKCPSEATKGAEDLQLGICLESVGVAAGDSLDEEGKPRFFSNSPMSLYYKQPLINKLHWYWRYIWHKHGVGPDCCSRHVVSFHDVDPRMMWTLEALLYRLHIHRDLQPPHLNTSSSIQPPLHTPSTTSHHEPSPQRPSSTSTLTVP